MNTIKIDIPPAQIRRAIKRINIYKTLTKAALSKAVFTSGVGIQNQAKKDVPVDTGRLRSSISHDHNPLEISSTIGSDVNYAYPVEINNTAFLFPAFESEKPKHYERLRKALSTRVL